ncbi:MAG TPA: pantoate--beta-alanine ligase [Nitrospirota bacterium]
MEIIEKPGDMHAASAKLRAGGKALGFVPTMGCLHEGHLSLVRAAREDNGAVAVSIFVNPTQFGPNEDLGRYPRDMEGDLAKCRAEGVDLVFVPSAKNMYPAGAVSFVDLGGGITGRLCGASRPGHFRGVATVVAKLFNIVSPERAYFGAKDYQQTVVIRRMAHDLDFPVEVVVLPTVREPDGLAMSSRNSYLGPAERKAAAMVYAALGEAAALYLSGERRASAVAGRFRDAVSAQPLIEVEYASVADPDDLSPLETVTGGAILAVAARAGATRLIDNIALS